MKMMKSILLFALFALLVLPGCDKDNDDPLTSSKYVEFNGAMRQLWADHMQWTFATVDAYFHNTAGVSAQLDRLLQNQQDIGAAIVPYYGQAAGDQLAALLTTHIQQAIPVLDAAKANDAEALETASNAWYANAKEIADFLADANPDHWNKTTLENHMKTHIDQTTTYAVDLLQNNYTSAVNHYDSAFDHMMDFADILSEGIAKQFPDKF